MGRKRNPKSQGNDRKNTISCEVRYFKSEKQKGKSRASEFFTGDCLNYQGSIHPYILCSTPRCGSTLLCDLLAQSGDLGVPHEYLNISSHGLVLMSRLGIDLTDPNLALTYLNTLKRARTTPNGIFGLQAHHHHLNILIDPPLLY